MFDNILFLLSAGLTLGGAVSVVWTKNLMHACVYLLCSLAGIAGLYVTLSADFLAAVQLVVYVGGVVILLLFAIMLTGGSSNSAVNRFGIEKIPPMGNLKTFIFGGTTALVVALVVLRLIGNVITQAPPVENLPYESTVEEIGILLVTDHVLAFEISSVLLLGALVGAALIARPRKKHL